MLITVVGPENDACIRWQTAFREVVVRTEVAEQVPILNGLSRIAKQRRVIDQFLRHDRVRRIGNHVGRAVAITYDDVPGQVGSVVSIGPAPIAGEEHHYAAASHVVVKILIVIGIVVVEGLVLIVDHQYDLVVRQVRARNSRHVNDVVGVPKAIESLDVRLRLPGKGRLDHENVGGASR